MSWDTCLRMKLCSKPSPKSPSTTLSSTSSQGGTSKIFVNNLKLPVTHLAQMVSKTWTITEAWRRTVEEQCREIRAHQSWAIRNSIRREEAETWGYLRRTSRGAKAMVCFRCKVHAVHWKLQIRENSWRPSSCKNVRSISIQLERHSLLLMITI